jgi:hypothetical protein
VLSGVATVSENNDAPFVAGDEVVTTMHVNIPNVVPLMTRLKKVVVELVGTGKSHVLFDNYAATEKGLANNLEHSTADDQTDSTTFRLTHVTLGLPASDPVFTVSGSVDQYSIYSIATVEYQTASGRRLAEVTTVRALPAKRGLSSISIVDVAAAGTMLMDSSLPQPGSSSVMYESRSHSSNAIIVIASASVVGAAFVVASTGFLVRSRIMRSRITASKSRLYYLNRASDDSSNKLRSRGVFFGDVLVSSQLASGSPDALHDGHAPAATGTQHVNLDARPKKSLAATRISRSSSTKKPSRRGALLQKKSSHAHSAPSRKVRKPRKLSPLQPA